MPRRFVLKCFEDPDTGPRLVSMAITEHDLMKYAVRCGDGMSRTKAFALLIDHRSLSDDDVLFLFRFTAQFGD